MLTNLLLALLRLYQLTVSRVLVALFGPVCRFEPSCSSYAMACVAGQGPVRGSLLSLKRLCKCHPFHPGGHDPPPPPRPGRLEKAWFSPSLPAARGAQPRTTISGAPARPSEPTGAAALDPGELPSPVAPANESALKESRDRELRASAPPAPERFHGTQ
jgi:hypothetical protein